MNNENQAHEPVTSGSDAILPENATLHPDPSENPAETPVETARPVPVSEEQFLESEAQPIADDHHDIAEDAEPEEDYSTMSADDLVLLLDKYVDEVEVPRFKARIANIRNFLASHFASVTAAAQARFVEEGGNKDDFAPVPDTLEDRFHQAIRKFNKKRIEFNEKLEKQRVDNLAAKNEILNQFKDLIQNEDNMNKAFERFHELQAKWRSVGPVPSAQARDLHMRYKVYIDKFYDYIKINRELQDLDQRKNLEAKLHLCELADELLLENSLNTAFRKLHQIQDKWRETGPVPREKKNEVWERFKATCDKLFERRKEFIEQASAQRTKNLEEKTKLCEAAEAVRSTGNWKHKDWQEATAVLADLQNMWKKIGPADKKVNDEIWNRFRTACDIFYKSKNDFYHKRKQEFSANLQLKTELCIQAEALQNNTDWKATTAELIRLQNEWKKIGPVGEKQSEKIWKRFRTACDSFFSNKSQHFSTLDKEHEENLKLKLALIDELEKFVPGDDTHASFEELKTYQRKWSELGMVPLNRKEEVNSRYKAVIDGHFDKLKISSGDRQKMRYQQKLEHIRHSDSPGKMDSERRFLMNKIAELKNEVQLWENNIGFFAKSKNADKLKSEFEEKISNAKEEINKLKSKLDMTREG